MKHQQQLEIKKEHEKYEALQNKYQIIVSNSESANSSSKIAQLEKENDCFLKNISFQWEMIETLLGKVKELEAKL